jgi:N-acetylmuramic acid 6-phosphate etherase
VERGLPATEGVDPATAEIDRLPVEACVRSLIETQRAAVDASLTAVPAIAATVEAIVAALQGGRRVVSFGAGSSGRLAVLDAAELLPTFALEPGRIEARIAGGDAALRRAIEGAEDDAAAGTAAAADLRPGDVALGISASGGAPYVIAALTAARRQGALTAALVSVPDSPLAAWADIAMIVPTGAEPIAGSTRMRAGTAQKIVLNALSTAAMIAVGKTYGNRMVDVVATNAKLRARAVRLVREIAGNVDAPALLAAAGARVKTAVVMARRGVDRATAEDLLERSGGRLGPVIDAG